MRVLAHMTKLRVLEQRANVATPTATPHSGRSHQSGCLIVTSVLPDTSTAGSSTAAKIAGPKTVAKSAGTETVGRRAGTPTAGSRTHD